jgi:adenosine deaminase
LSPEEIVRLVRNGLEAAFVTEAERQALLMRLNAYVAAHTDVLAPATAS